MEKHKTGIIIESLVLFAFQVCIGIWAAIAAYLFLLPVPPDSLRPAFVQFLISKWDEEAACLAEPQACQMQT